MKVSKNTSKMQNAKVQMIVAMVIFGTIGVFVRNISLSSGEIALFRAIIAIIAIICFQMGKKHHLKLQDMKGDLYLLILSGVAMAFNWILLFQAYTYTSISIATLSYYFAPAIVTIVSPILFRERLTKRQIICFVMATVGLVLIMDIGSIKSGSRDFIGIILGLGAATLYASVILINKKIKKVSGMDRTICQFGAAIVVLIPYVLLTSGIHIIELPMSGFINLLILGLIHTGGAYCIYFSSVKNLPGQKVAILSYIDPLVAIIISALLLTEEIGITQIIGGFIILGFTLWNELGKS